MHFQGSRNPLRKNQDNCSSTSNNKIEADSSQRGLAEASVNQRTRLCAQKAVAHPVVDVIAAACTIARCFAEFR